MCEYQREALLSVHPFIHSFVQWHAGCMQACMPGWFVGWLVVCGTEAVFLSCRKRHCAGVSHYESKSARAKKSQPAVSFTCSHVLVFVPLSSSSSASSASQLYTLHLFIKLPVGLSTAAKGRDLRRRVDCELGNGSSFPATRSRGIARGREDEILLSKHRKDPRMYFHSYSDGSPRPS